MSVLSNSFPITVDNSLIIQKHLTVQNAAEVTGYNIQYLRRMLRSGALEGRKIGQMWLIEVDALEEYLKHVETTSDRRCGPR
jgi:excisionase family DNA binding protein